MDRTAIEERLSRLEQKNAELEREIQLLRAVPQAKQDASEGELLSRRGLLTGATYALGAVGLSLMGTRASEASSGAMFYGASNYAAESVTTLAAGTHAYTFVANNIAPSPVDELYANGVYAFSARGTALRAETDFSSNGHGAYINAHGAGHGVLTVKDSEMGHAVLAYQKATTGFYAAIAGVT